MEKQNTIDIMKKMIELGDKNADFGNPLNCYLKSIAVGIEYLVEKFEG